MSGGLAYCKLPSGWGIIRMLSTRQSEIVVAREADDTAYARARRILRLDEPASRGAALPVGLIVWVEHKRERDRLAPTERAVTQALLFRKKYWDA